jgi:adenosylmethionine-8-amino-7-oxononanoate aminotransferase
MLSDSLERIARLPGVKQTRQCGLMIGIELVSQSGREVGYEVCDRARSHGVILRPLGDVVVWMPPLSLREDEVALLETATASAIREVT